MTLKHEHLAKALNMVSKSLAQPRKEHPMTTTYTCPTPAERNLARADFLLARPGEPTGDNWALGFEYGWAIAYRRAKAEDAKLLGAAKAAYVNLARWQDAEQWDDEDEVVMIRLTEAIADAEGRTP